ncbi:hypothetical protein [Bosea lathyri]|jgi:hypothetical protein|uniref:Uncharacterized protein n=1 Tax=Bosea lathyri TaxID=1036778 RepID=A0A1H6AUN5_9HYPH|nr:hypothetical protein [Bosea lathyri]SEG52112.1 hypothetical protein SAMN04488115_106148 [Bosea lathyri]
MAEIGDREGGEARAAAGSAMLLLQLAAAQAEIGPFARRGRETPGVAAQHYRTASCAAVAWRWPNRRLT